MSKWVLKVSEVALFLSMFELCQETDGKGSLPPPPPAGRGLRRISCKSDIIIEYHYEQVPMLRCPKQKYDTVLSLG